ncbi:UNVERIFIED_CONTAM: hypothetical protein ABID98_001872 [Brevibacillus sp. OAP136]
MSSQRLKQLHELLTANPYQKKVVMTNSFSQGHQWLEQLGRTYGSVLNTSIQTPKSLALQNAQLALVENQLTYTPQEEVFWIVQSLMRELATGENAYIPLSLITPGVVSCFCSAINEVRHAKLNAIELNNRAFENPEKGRYVQKLLSQYESYMAKNKRVDDADLRSYVQPDPNEQVLYIIDENIHLSIMEQEILNTITRNQLSVLESDVPFTTSNSGFLFSETSFFHALGPLAEVREVLRQVAAYNASWDEVEIIASDYATYASSIYNVIAPFSIPCSYSKGIPISYSKIGKAVGLYFKWVESGYQLEPILQSFKQGLLRVTAEGESVTDSSFIQVLEKSGIGWGRERYALLANVKEGLEKDQQHVAADLLTDFFGRLFEVLPEDKRKWSPRNVLEGLVRFCDVVPSFHENDIQARSGIKQLLQTFDHAPQTAMDQRTAIQFAREAIDGIVISVESVPSEGKLLVTSLQDGGQSGRHYTFIVGMDEKAWSVPVNQDPILLDIEREQLSPGLITSKDKAAIQEKERASRLSMIRGLCTLSFNSYCVSDNEEVNPAFEMLEVFRRSSGDTEATYETLMNRIHLPIGFVSSPSVVSLDTQDVWMKSLILGNGQLNHANGHVLTSYTHLADGERAIQARKSLPITSLMV